MRRVFTIGETVLDILFKNNDPVTAKAGGSMLNASVTLGRLKIPVSFISEYGTDRVGNIVDSFLISNGVDTKYINRFSDGKSAVALAFLDDNQNADYSFYKNYPAKRLDVDIPDLTNDDIFLFGSFFGIAPEIRPTLIKILSKAKQKGALIIYDPNFRKTHLNELNELLPFIIENIKMADIIKGSDEDFKIIFNACSPEEAFRCLHDPSKVLVYTKGRDGAYLYTEKEYMHLKAKPVVPVSTVGAGDNFNAGLAFGLLQNNVTGINILNTKTENWKEVLKHGINFASEVCLSYDNYIPEHFATDYINNQLKYIIR